MRAVVTGITGFIGSHLAESLVAHGHQVFGLARTGRWRQNTPGEIQAHCSIHGWDLVKPMAPDVQAKIQAFRPDCVFHFAGISIPSQCGQRTPTPEAIAVNVGGTRHLLDCVRLLSRTPKLIFTSSCHVYSPIDQEHPCVEEAAAVGPVSAYGRTKLAGESLIRTQEQSSDLKACVVRGFHHIGPRQPAGLMLTDWLRQLAEPACTRLRVKSTNSHLDLVDVRDAVDAYRLLAENDNAQGLYNLGSGQISRSGAVLQAMLNLMGRSVEVVEDSSIPSWNAIADIRKLRRLGWQPTRSYQDTIASMIADLP